MTNTNLRQKIYEIVDELDPIDLIESKHIEETKAWIQSDEPLFRIAKPDNPPKHLISYCCLYDAEAKQLLLVDHKKAQLWLPTGGHIDPGEHPLEAAKRELQEELGIKPAPFIEEPLFLTVTQTCGDSGKHTDVSLWYVFKGNRHQKLQFDRSEFESVHWYPISHLPLDRSDPHMGRFIEKLIRY